MKSFSKADLEKLRAKAKKKRRGRKAMQQAGMLSMKPLSVNECWMGRRFKTASYKAYEEEALLRLPNNIKVGSGRLSLSLTAGFSNKQADIDNICKPFVDILQKKYGFNDNQIYKLTLIKEIVGKGEEFISFSFV